MTTDKPNSLWLIVASAFLVVIVISSVVIWARRDRGQAIVITEPPSTAPARQMGAVQAAPGQKIDINRAEAWLLQALPEIGEVRANDIIAYRSQHGPFRTVEDILNVPGINSSTFQKIKDLICVVD